jgi:hypothetical protein
MASSSYLDIYHFQNLAGEPVRQLLILEAIIITTAAITDNQIDVMGRYVPATDVTVIIAFAVEGADHFIHHGNLIC